MFSFKLVVGILIKSIEETRILFENWSCWLLPQSASVTEADMEWHVVETLSFYERYPGIEMQTILTE